MKPTIGKVVLYNITQTDATAMADMPNCNVQEVLPATIVAIWNDSEDYPLVNLSVTLDGEGTMWKTSISLGEGQGQFQWIE